MRRKDGTQGLKLPYWFPGGPGPHLPLARPAGRCWWLGRESRAASTQRAPRTPGPPSSSQRGSGTRRSSGPESGGRWTEAGKGGGREGREGAPLCPMPSTRARKAAARDKPAGLGMSFTIVVSHTVGCMRNSRAWGVPCWILQRVTDTLEVHRIMRAKPSTWGNKFG